MAQHNAILIVEDEAVVAMELEDAVSDLGWSVIGPFARVQDAMASLDGQAIDGAILDVQLADGDLTPMARRLEEAGIPFVVHSGGELPARLADAAADVPVIVKPTPTATLLTQLMVEMSTRAQRAA